VLVGAAAGEPVGTRFEARNRRLSARKLWIAFAARVAGSVTVDDGAVLTWTPAVRRPRIRELQSIALHDVVGTIAGDDTIFVACTDASAMRRFRGRLERVLAEVSAASPIATGGDA